MSHVRLLLTRQHLLLTVLGALTAVTGLVSASDAAPSAPLLVPPGMKVERVVMLYRHGLRAPLTEEIGARAYSRDAWPVWSTPPSLLTPHGREAMRQLGLYDRAWFASLGLLPVRGCPGETQAAIWSNTEARTIASGEELSEGLAPGCQLAVGHLPLERKDPLFNAAAAMPAFDASAAVALINAQSGGPAAIVAPHGTAIHTLETILGCRGPGEPQPCDIAALPASLTVSDDGRGLTLSGPIEITSGTAEVLLLEYGEGMPMERVGWGRATPTRLSEVSRLHALLFEIFDRPIAMSHRTAAAMAPHISALLAKESAPPVTLLIGHDNNIAAMAALVGVHFQIPGYGMDDLPLGGALSFAVLRDIHTGTRSVRVFYQAQTLEQLRALTPLSLRQPPAMQVLVPSCAGGPQRLCSLSGLQALLRWPDSSAETTN